MRVCIFISMLVLVQGDHGEFLECDNLTAFDNRTLGRWMGRTAMDADHQKFVWDLHIISEDGTGVLNEIHPDDPEVLVGKKPRRMWCLAHPNTIDFIVKAQYGPDNKGLMLCMDLQVRYQAEELMNVKFNPVLFTNPVSAMLEGDKYSCVNYHKHSTLEGYSVAFDRLDNPSEITWSRTQREVGAGDFPLVTGDLSVSDDNNTELDEGILKRSIRL